MCTKVQLPVEVRKSYPTCVPYVGGALNFHAVILCFEPILGFESVRLAIHILPAGDRRLLIHMRT
jgi:hypothetical protein